MIYSRLKEKLLKKGFNIVERDDRLLDIFPILTREKGVELWSKWGNDTIYFVSAYIDLPSAPSKSFKLTRHQVESALLSYTIIEPHQISLKTV